MVMELTGYLELSVTEGRRKELGRRAQGWAAAQIKVWSCSDGVGNQEDPQVWAVPRATLTHFSPSGCCVGEVLLTRRAGRYADREVARLLPPDSLSPMRLQYVVPD